MNNRKKLLFIINDLDIGGAETVLYQLIRNLDQNHFEIALISLHKPGEMYEKYIDLGIKIYSLSVNIGHFRIFKLLKLKKIIKAIQPDLIHTWMYHSDLIGGLAGKLVGNIPIVWGIRHSNLEPKFTKLSTLIVIKICACFSHIIPHKIIFCSMNAMQNHIEFGYDHHKSAYIPNGFDVNKFVPNQNLGKQYRDLNDINPNILLIGMAARYHPIKDHENFILAASQLHQLHPEIEYILCGHEISTNNPYLMNEIRKQGLENKFHLLGQQTDMPAFYNAINIGTLTSYSEAFPNTVGEMMLCGVPVVATDVGDVTDIVNSYGYVVPTQNPDVLSSAWLKLVSLEKTELENLRIGARKHICRNFSLDAIVQQYVVLYDQLME